MADPVERAVRQELGRISDDLHRAKMQRRADPTWRSGNGESIDAVVAGYQDHYDRLRATAAAYGIRL